MAVRWQWVVLRAMIFAQTSRIEGHLSRQTHRTLPFFLLGDRLSGRLFLVLRFGYLFGDTFLGKRISCLLPNSFSCLFSNSFGHNFLLAIRG